MKRIPTVFAVCCSLVSTTLVLWSPAASAQRKKQGEEAEQVPYLVWPLPPDPPRIRYLGEVRHNFDVEPRKKKTVFQRLIGAPDPNITKTLGKPAGLATDAQGRLLVADSTRGWIHILDQTDRAVSYLTGAEGIGPKTPLDVATDSQDRIFVADAGLESVLVYTPEGTLTSVVADREKLTNPAGLALDEGRDRLYVLDSQGHRVVVVSLSTLHIVDSFLERGTGLGKVNFPAGIAVDKAGRIYVSDTGSCTVQVFSPDYRPVTSFGGRGVAPSQFTRPKQVALDSEGHVYVVDAAFDNFQVFSQDFALLLFVGARGEKPGTFNLPWGIHIDADDRIYVSDQLNGRVQIFQFLGGG